MAATLVAADPAPQDHVSGPQRRTASGGCEQRDRRVGDLAGDWYERAEAVSPREAAEGYVDRNFPRMTPTFAVVEHSGRVHRVEATVDGDVAMRFKVLESHGRFVVEEFVGCSALLTYESD